MPSGVDGNSGQATGASFTADLTVTFFRKKPGHLLYPGRGLCGEVVVADIGICRDVLATIVPKLSENLPEAWLDHFPRLALQGHKYDKGHVVAVSGPAFKTGAARLAASGALRAGAGLVTVASPPGALAENAAQLTTVMLKEVGDASELTSMLEDRRLNSIVLGPGLGLGQNVRDMVLAALSSHSRVVLDADGLTLFESEPNTLFAAIEGRKDQSTILTPHTGEFSRLFGKVTKPGESKLELTRSAAATSHATVILKGPDTVIASPDGRCAINSNAPPTLGTAGSGDVLAGICAGLLAQKMPAHEAACAAVWMHGYAANCFGRGLISEDLPGLLPKALGVLEDLISNV